MSAEQMTAMALVSRERVASLRQMFQQAFPVELAPRFTAVLAAIDLAQDLGRAEPTTRQTEPIPEDCAARANRERELAAAAKAAPVAAIHTAMAERYDRLANATAHHPAFSAPRLSNS